MKHLLVIFGRSKLKILMIFGLILFGCTNHTEEPEIDDTIDLQITVKWHDGSFELSQEQRITGLAWTLSSLGAELPEGSLENTITLSANDTYILDLSSAGFSEGAENALSTIIKKIKEHSSYQMHEYIDVGRFVMLTLNSSFHYYKIIGIPESIEAFADLHQFKGKKMRVINSSISIVNRLIEIGEASLASDIAYVSSEGAGEFENDNFITQEFEVMDLMPNGQFRFALYNKNGQLKSSADQVLTNAGKPAKCLWCHEINIQPFFREDPVLDGAGYLSAQEFLDLRDQQTDMLNIHRASSGEIDFGQRKEHTLMEKIYIDFMEPSVERLSSEWEVSVEEIYTMLQNLETHTHAEFGIENLYRRNDVDLLGPFEILDVPESARESSNFEPNYF